MARAYLSDTRTGKKNLHKQFLNLIMRAASCMCSIPIQDYLGYDNRCRINTPSTIGTNWRWRMKQGVLTEELQKEILFTTKLYGRMNWN